MKTQTCPSTNSKKPKARLYLELILLFVGLPILLVAQSQIIHPSTLVLPLLILLVLYLRANDEFELKDLFSLNISRRVWLQHLSIIVLSFVFLTLYVWLTEPENLFNLVQKSPHIWLVLSIVYPLFSAYGQEVIFRLFMHLRYRPILGEGRSFVLINAALFSFAHIIYYSPLSLLLTFLAGLYLAWIYLHYRSVLFVAILHGLLGNIVFTVGLGEHFWVGIDKFLQ